MTGILGEVYLILKCVPQLKDIIVNNPARTQGYVLLDNTKKKWKRTGCSLRSRSFLTKIGQTGCFRSGRIRLTKKKLVNSGIKQNCQSYITEMQMKHYKKMYLKQGSVMKEYLKTDQLNLKEKQLLFKLRVRMTPKKYKDNVICSLCKNLSSVENLIHLLQCPCVEILAQ